MKWLDVPAPMKRRVIDRMTIVIADIEQSLTSGLAAQVLSPERIASLPGLQAAIVAAIAELERVPVHARVGPAMDVAACTERGSHLRFSMSGAGITCPTCKQLRFDKVKADAQGARLVKVNGAMKAARRSSVPGRDE
jgi:hypothetical protein